MTGAQVMEAVVQTVGLQTADPNQHKSALGDKKDSVLVGIMSQMHRSFVICFKCITDKTYTFHTTPHRFPPSSRLLCIYLPVKPYHKNQKSELQSGSQLNRCVNKLIE